MAEREQTHTQTQSDLKGQQNCTKRQRAEQYHIHISHIHRLQFIRLEYVTRKTSEHRVCRCVTVALPLFGE